MRFAALGEAGPLLDRRIARRIFGRRASATPPSYSTDESAADALVARLEQEALTAAFEQDEGSWYCVFWIVRSGDEAKERIATGSGETRPLALCRAVLNLRLEGTSAGPRLRTTTPGWLGSEEPGASALPAPRKRAASRPAVTPSKDDAPWLLPDEPRGEPGSREGSGS